MDGIKKPYNLMSDEGFDPVDKPEHYAKGSLECIDWIRLALTEEEYHGYLKGCVLKYFWRHEDKGNPTQDLEKLRKYAEFLIDQFEREETERDILEANKRCAAWLVNNEKESFDDGKNEILSSLRELIEDGYLGVCESVPSGNAFGLSE